MCRLLVLAFLSAAAMQAAATWFDLVAPIMSSAEKKTYQSLNAEARAAFEQNFWTEKSIEADEYFRRLQYIDSTFGSSKTGSGANTDPGRVYLSLGAPQRITHLPSSRIFVPLEIWYYETVPALHMNGELRLVFFQKNNQGLPQLFSPTLNTLRDLLVPQAGTAGLFSPNDSITEAGIRTKLTVGPAEDEVITAAVGVSDGIKYSGNDEILAKLTSPRLMLGKPQQTEVLSRLVPAHPALTTLQTRSAFGGMQVDLQLALVAQRQVAFELSADGAPIASDRLQLNLARSQPVQYTHRLDLLPGVYRLMVTVDGEAMPYAITVPDALGTGQIVRANTLESTRERPTPFQFLDKHYDLDDDGRYAILAAAHPGPVAWTVRRGLQIVWRSSSEAEQIAAIELPLATLQAGRYSLEAVAGGESRSIPLTISPGKTPARTTATLSYNANLSPGARYNALCHQWLLRGNLTEARSAIEHSLQQGTTNEAQIELARIDAMSGQLDRARDRVRRILSLQPTNFDALAVLAYVETQFQDYAVAAGLYRKALAVQDSPTIRAALAELPQ